MLSCSLYEFLEKSWVVSVSKNQVSIWPKVLSKRDNKKWTPVSWIVKSQKFLSLQLSRQRKEERRGERVGRSHLIVDLEQQHGEFSFHSPLNFGRGYLCVSFLSIIFTEVLVAPSKSVQTTLSSPQTPCLCPSIVPSQDLPIKLWNSP